MPQLTVKPTRLPYLPGSFVYTARDGSTATAFIGAGISGKEFDPRVNEHGDQWVMVNGVVVVGGIGPNGLPFGARTDQFGNIAPALPSVSIQGSTTLVAFSTANEASHIVKVTGGVVLGISGYNSKASSQFIQLFDYFDPITAVPAAGSTSIVGFTVSPTSNYSVDFGRYGLPCVRGIVVANSSTNPTLTIGSADCTFTVVYS